MKLQALSIAKPIFNLKSCIFNCDLQVGAEIPMDSSEADEENKQAGGKTLLYVLERGCE